MSLKIMNKTSMGCVYVVYQPFNIAMVNVLISSSYQHDSDSCDMA